MSFTIYNTTSGQIIRNVSSSIIGYLPTVETNESYINGRYDCKYYFIPSGVATLRPTQSTTIDKTAINANGNDVVTISNAPIGATCTISNSETVTGIIDGTDTFVTTIPGTYFMTISLFPFLDFTAVINAT